MLFFGCDIKKEIHLWPEDDDFKALLYQQGELQGTNVGLLFIIYVTIGKTCYLKTLLYCTQLDYVGIGTYVHRQRQYSGIFFPMGC